jgi:hypothetical protein
MDVDYQLRYRHGDTLFKIHPAELHRRLRYLETARGREAQGRILSRERPDPRPGIEDPETIYLLRRPAGAEASDEAAGSGGGGTGDTDSGKPIGENGRPVREELVALERCDEARLQGRASLMSEPAAMSPPRGPEALIAFAEKAKDGGNYDAANAAFALALRTHFPRLECSLSVRETPKTPTGEMADGYYDLAYIRAGEEETCIPVPMLGGEVAYWFAAHAERRAPQAHHREPTGPGPTIEDLEAMRGRGLLAEAVRDLLTAGALDGRYATSQNEDKAGEASR